MQVIIIWAAADAFLDLQRTRDQLAGLTQRGPTSAAALSPRLTPWPCCATCWAGSWGTPPSLCLTSGCGTARSCSCSSQACNKSGCSVLRPSRPLQSQARQL